jgi:hypothetical protein
MRGDKSKQKIDLLQICRVILNQKIFRIIMPVHLFLSQSLSWPITKYFTENRVFNKSKKHIFRCTDEIIEFSALRFYFFPRL